MKELIKKMMYGTIPVPAFARPLVKMLYVLGILINETMRRLYGMVLVGPVLKSIATVGSRLRIERMPYIRGLGKINIGSDVYISGKIDIAFSLHSNPVPEFVVGNGSFIGHGCMFAMARGINIGDNCLIAGGVSIQDNDGHPLDPQKRFNMEPVDDQDIHPVTIKDRAWIGRNAVILKGVTVGENSVVGAGSVVVSDVPVNTVVAGNPAKIIREL